MISFLTEKKRAVENFLLSLVYFIYGSVTLFIRRVDQLIQSITSLTKQAIITSIAVFVLSCVFTWFAFFLYTTFYYYYIPVVAHMRPVYLNFSPNYDRFPEAHVDFTGEIQKRFLYPGQAYDISIYLHVPESEVNYQLGMFMVNIDLMSFDNSTIHHSSRPCMILYKSALLQTIETFFFSPLYLFGIFHQSQYINVPLLERIYDSYYRADAITKAKISISRPEIHIYQSRLHINAVFSGLRYLMYNWFFTTAFIGICSIIIWEWTIALVIFFIFRYRSRQSQAMEYMAEDEDEDYMDYEMVPESRSGSNNNNNNNNNNNSASSNKVESKKFAGRGRSERDRLDDTLRKEVSLTGSGSGGDGSTESKRKLHVKQEVKVEKEEKEKGKEQRKVTRIDIKREKEYGEKQQHQREREQVLHVSSSPGAKTFGTLRNRHASSTAAVAAATASSSSATTTMHTKVNIDEEEVAEAGFEAATEESGSDNFIGYDDTDQNQEDVIQQHNQEESGQEQLEQEHEESESWEELDI